MKNPPINTEWDQVELLDRLEQSWRIVGTDDDGNNYEAAGKYESETLVEISDIEIITKERFKRASVWVG